MRALASAVATATLTLGLAACAAEPGQPEPLAEDIPEPSTTPPPELDPAEAEAVADVLAVFRGFRQVENELSAEPPPPAEAEERLSEHLADPFRFQVQVALHAMYQHGLARQAEPTSEADVVELRLDEKPPVATIRDCLDSTSWTLVDSQTGEAENGGTPPEVYAAEPGRHVRLVQAKRFDDGRWLLDQGSWERGESC